MGKIVKRLIFEDDYRNGRNESWFSDMSERGLHLKRVDDFVATFEKGEPKKTKYRIDAIGVGYPIVESILARVVGL